MSDKTAWLIELSPGEGFENAWLLGLERVPLEKPRLRWTPLADSAIKFCTREDATTVMNEFVRHMYWGSRALMVTEHMWCDDDRSSHASGEVKP
jgi:hypothetical protein